ncbi:MAG: UDP-N-acetylmuramoyl-L-alanyl-D-glutamate--2,6-diaminopimelate ligase [Deltaproteobacteria bacterium HGW-Deltaproteobacteria-14]|nr:MAG: UDP-N-acetylmuramoyl-L-alanyl-D-glutamate--2,6-diaminopimelate ligase [Deltaproteobacteria bacterium HGW-Deltaproteobacteria-14]
MSAHLAPRPLSALVVDLAQAPALTGPRDVAVTHYSSDSREIGPAGLFVAVRGFTADGHDYLDAAIAAGAAAVIAEVPRPASLPAGVAWLQVPDTTWALAVIADAFWSHPSETVQVLATTGTNGKTTITYLLRDILRAAGHVPGLLSTVEVLIGDERQPTIFTTPPAPALQALLAAMRDRGCTHAVVEASSHGLQQYRIAAFKVAVAGFTNLTRDHLDYHETMAAYLAAKTRLFSDLARAACINIDDPAGRGLAAAFAGPLLTVSRSGAAEADLRALTAIFDLDGCRVTVATPEGDVALTTRLIGAHNLENALVALGMARLAGVPYAVAASALATATGARGRLERVATAAATGPAVFVDYAHTPDALDNVLTALRPLVAGRLVCVFGAGGDRDRGKRPEMAAASARTADLSVVTSDNPRTEDPDAIIADIVAGLPAGAPHLVEPDRRAAIARAVADAGPGDAVLIAGKGHEDYQIVGTTRHPFDDARVAREALEQTEARP